MSSTALVAAACLTSGPIRAESPSDVATARLLASEGMDRADRSDCKGALDLLARAEALHHAAVHLQYTARCLAAGGRLVEAAEVWRKLANEAVPESAHEVTKKAVAEARVELPKVEARLGTLTLTLRHAPREAAISLDGAPLAAAAVGVPRVVDPGRHEWVAKADGCRDANGEIVLEEGARREIAIDLDALPAPATSVTPLPSATSSERALETPPPPSASPWRTIGFVAGGAGAAMVIVGAIALAERNADRDAILADCPNLACTTDHGPQKTHVEHLTAATNVLMFGGGALLAAGVSLVIFGGESRSITVTRDGVAARFRF